MHHGPVVPNATRRGHDIWIPADTISILTSEDTGKLEVLIGKGYVIHALQV